MECFFICHKPVLQPLSPFLGQYDFWFQHQVSPLDSAVSHWGSADLEMVVSGVRVVTVLRGQALLQGHFTVTPPA